MRVLWSILMVTAALWLACALLAIVAGLVTFYLR